MRVGPEPHLVECRQRRKRLLCPFAGVRTALRPKPRREKRSAPARRQSQTAKSCTISGTRRPRRGASLSASALWRSSLKPGSAGLAGGTARGRLQEEQGFHKNVFTL